MHKKNKKYNLNNMFALGTFIVLVCALSFLCFYSLSNAKYASSFSNKINLTVSRGSSLSITFDALEGEFPDKDKSKSIEQTEGQNFSIPAEDPELSGIEGSSFQYWYEITETGDHVDWTDKLSTEIVADDNLPYNNRLYAQYKEPDKHRVVVKVANPELGGLITWKEGEETVSGTYTEYNAPDLIGGEKLKYSLDSYYEESILIGSATFSRGGQTVQVFSSNNGTTGNIVFSRLDIIDEYGKFPGWAGEVNSDITIYVYFTMASYSAYWVGNQTANDVTITTAENKTYTIESKAMYFFCDDNKSAWDAKSTELGSKYFIAVDCPLNADQASSWKYTYYGGWGSWKGNCTKISIDESFKNFPLQSTKYMFDHFSKAGMIEHIENIWVFGVNNLSNTFNSCSGLISIDLSKWDVRNVTDSSYCFCQCTNEAFTSINLSYWDFQKCENFKSMFSGCKFLQHIYVADSSVHWWTGDQPPSSASAKPPSTSMFYQCVALHNAPSSVGSAFLKNAYCQDTEIKSLDSGFFETYPGHL